MRQDLHGADKAELHIHLEGSIGSAALIEIDNSLTSEEIAAHTAFDTFDGFLRSYIWVNKRLQTPDHYAIAARHLFDAFEQQGVRYAEVTLSAGMVLWKEQSLPAVYDALWRESQNANIKVLWILDAIRQFGPEHGMEVARFAASRRDDGVVAFGIGGDEARGPAGWFKDVFQFARDSGLHLVCHAGETTGPESIWDALSIGAERIGHGIAAARDPELMTHLCEHNIPLEICITSNVRTGAVASIENHPVRTLYEAGVPITINTDDPALFNTTLSNEYNLASTLGLPDLTANSFKYAFSSYEDLES